MIFIAGTDNLLCRAFLPVIEKETEILAINLSSESESDYIDALFIEKKPSVVIIFPPFADIEKAEHERETAYKLNAFMLRDLSLKAAKHGCLSVFISSSYIYSDKQNLPHSEQDEPCPVSAFGDSMLLAEKFLLQSSRRSLIIRLPDLYGGEIPISGMNFVRRISDTEYNVIDGMIISPTLVSDVVEAAARLIRLKAEGAYNFSNSGYTDPDQFLRHALELKKKKTGDDRNFTVNKLDQREFYFAAARPGNTALTPGRYTKFTHLGVRSWSDALDDYASNGNFLI